MSLIGPYIHNIDPVIGTIFGIHLWWYGLSYTLGFMNARTFIGRRAAELGLDRRRVYNLCILIALGVLVGGRVVEVAFYEWPFYAEQPYLIPAYWLGGMASHGLLIGGIVSVWIFCRIYDKPFLMMTDVLSVPATFILGMGRIGNFIDGQILGSVTDVPWAVKFPDAEGFRHPVVLYDGIKNLAIIPILLLVGRRNPPRGIVTGLFLFLYAFLRIPIDVFREYPTSLLGLATGQALNFGMSVAGLVIICLCFRLLTSRDAAASPESASVTPEGVTLTSAPIGWRKPVFVAILLFCLAIPSDWTQDIPMRYGDRHPGLVHSAMYPRIDAEIAAE